MRVLGIEFNASFLNYVLLDVGEENTEILTVNRLTLAATRSKDALKAFQAAVQSMYNVTKPDRVAIKTKPERGAMSAGAASLKMEGIALANAPCEVEFVSAQKIAKLEISPRLVKKYLEPAYKAAASHKQK
ncbi:DUF3010 family protein [Mesorhizobium sp. M0220]|uniref:DUF3010 family protein n=1 Tax=unclassified Mesorhizobium TaxID=325217 RepID=UPI003339C8B5